MKSTLALVLFPLIALANPKEEVLRDAKGHKVGTVKRDSGVEKIYDSKGHYQGQYRSSDNTTRDSKGHKVGTGNQNTKNLK